MLFICFIPNLNNIFPNYKKSDGLDSAKRDRNKHDTNNPFHNDLALPFRAQNMDGLILKMEAFYINKMKISFFTNI